MAFWLVQVVNGVSYGMLLFLVAVGLSLVLGLMGYLNLAHGAFVALGGYLGLTLVKATDNYWLAVVVGAVAVMAVGAVLQQLLLNRFRSDLTQVLGTSGVILIMIDVSLVVWGGVPEVVRLPGALGSTFTVLAARLPIYRVALVALGGLVFLAMWWFQERTRYGAIIRAGLDDPTMVQALGINLGRISALVFAVGALLAGLAGVLGGPVIGVQPLVPYDMLLMAMVVIVIGGLGSVQGAFLAALVVGLTDNIGRALFPSLAYFTLFVPMALLLVFRPSGLMGRK